MQYFAWHLRYIIKHHDAYDKKLLRYFTLTF